MGTRKGLEAAHLKFKMGMNRNTEQKIKYWDLQDEKRKATPVKKKGKKK